VRLPRLRSGLGPWGRLPFVRFVVLLFVAGVAAAGVRVLFVQSFVVPSPSMQPLLAVGDRVLVSRFDYRVGDVRRGDVIVFDGRGVFDVPARPARSQLAAVGRVVAGALGAPIGEYDYVGRVVGLPGERVVCCDVQGRVSVDGRPLDEPYLRQSSRAGGNPFDVRVPPGRLFVMGDERDDSGGSQAHLSDLGSGTVPLNHVVGRVVSIWWPWGRATVIGRMDA
jgi:signal peptidase I